MDEKKSFSNIDVLLVILFLFLTSVFFINCYFKNKSSLPLVKHRTLDNLKNCDYAENNSFENNMKGVGGYYIPEPITSPVTYFIYRVKSGDSIHAISYRFGVDEVTIINLNDVKIPSRITRGTKLLIPNQDGISVPVKGNLDDIAEKYQYEKEELLRINSVTDKEKITSLFIPGIHFDSISKSLILGEYFRRPTYGRFTSYFGFRKDPYTKRKSFHQGIDIANREGTYIYSAAPGKVIFAGKDAILGNLIKIQHTSGYVSYYGHLRNIYVKRNQWIASGVIIGTMGNTGRSTGSHLHFEIRRYGRVINPMRVTVF